MEVYIEWDSKDGTSLLLSRNREGTGNNSCNLFFDCGEI